MTQTQSLQPFAFLSNGGDYVLVDENNSISHLEWDGERGDVWRPLKGISEEHRKSLIQQADKRREFSAYMAKKGVPFEEQGFSTVPQHFPYCA